MNFQDICDILTFGNGQIDDELVLLYALPPKRITPKFHHYKEFNINDYTDEECYSNFRFDKGEINQLLDVFGIPEKFVTQSGTRMSGQDSFMLMLRRLAYPNRYSELCPMFGREVPELSMVFNMVIDHVDINHGHLLTDMNQEWLSRDNLQAMSDAVHDKGAPLTKCWGFIDGTARPICRPIRNQKVVFSSHKRSHVIKFQSIMAANGLIAHLFGPFEGSRHDAAMWAASDIENTLVTRMAGYQIYGDPAYPMRRCLIAPFRGANLSEDETEFNSAMSKVRQSVEWGFGDIIRNFAFLDFKKNQKLYLQPVGKYYRVGTILANCITCLRGNSTSRYFRLQPPSLVEYVRPRQ